MSQPAEQISDNHEVAPLPVVLVVDDDAMIRRLMHKTLSREGFSVIEAENGKIALEMIDAANPDIVLMDVEMPVMDGFTACEELRRRNPNNPLPVLMVTGNDDTASVNRAYDVGATDFTNKPINFPNLGYRVRYLLRTSRMMTDLASTVFELDKSRAMLARAQQVAKLGSWEIDPQDQQMSWSEEFFRILGLTSDVVNPSLNSFLERIHEADRDSVREWFNLVLQGSRVRQMFYRIILPDGSERYVQQQVSISNQTDETVHDIYGTLQDITAQQEYQDKIKQLAFFDTLTGLPNRESFMQQIERSLDKCTRHEFKLAVMFLDVDDFKRVNDTLGHTAGDQLLQIFADRLKNSIRATDTVASRVLDDKTSVVARFGGDEFTLLLTGIQDTQHIEKIAQRLLDVLNEPMDISGHEIVISPSIGIAEFPKDGTDSDTLLKNADTAMYSAKNAGKNHYQFFDVPMSESVRNRLTMENQLRKAIERNELSLHYQPQQDTVTGKVFGIEALLRWNSEKFGNVPPDEFIPLAESSSLIISIGEWVLRTACSQLKSWLDMGQSIEHIAVNISVRQFTQKGFVDLVASILAETGLQAQNLELEITEGLLMQDVDSSIDILNSLKQIGVVLAIDDFGTGYSSLSYLKRFPIDRLKIDQSFIHDILNNADDEAITRAVIAMAHSMNLDVIAEGVETEEQLQSLKNLDCREIQGYFLSRPLPVDDVVPFLMQTNQGN